MNKKVIIMDIDGTLVDRSGVITKETKEALLKAQLAGVKLVLASGRPLNGMTFLAKELEMDKHHGLCVCFNGAKVIDVETNEVLFDQTMTVEEGKAVLRHMKQFDVVPLITKNDYTFVENVFNCMIHMGGKELNILEHESHDNNFLLCEVKDLTEFLDFPLNKILTYGEADYLKEHYQKMAAPFADTLTSMFTSPFYYEFTPKGIDKVKALDTVLSAMGFVQEELIAFGDAQNDITMVQYAGVGIAMGNAVEELKNAADEVTDVCGADGIAHALYKHLPEIFQ